MIEEEEKTKYNMSKSNVYTWIAIILLIMLGLFAMYLIGKGTECADVCQVIKIQGENVQECQANPDCTKYKLMGFFCLFAIIAVIFYLWWRDRKRPKIPFHKIKSAYIKEMEIREKISINPLAETYKLTEEGERYVFVLRDYVDDIAHYYMCEANVYFGAFGRGFGQWTTKEAEAMYWYQTRKKIDVRQMLSKELQTQQVRQMLLKSKQQEAALNKVTKGEEGDFR